MDRGATADPQVAAAQDASRGRAERWYNQMHAAQSLWRIAEIDFRGFGKPALAELARREATEIADKARIRAAELAKRDAAALLVASPS